MISKPIVSETSLLPLTDQQERFQNLAHVLNNHIIGQTELTSHLLIALLTNGHLLVEGPPGLAKTKAIKTLAQQITCTYHRIQFTPDLLPSDITGTDIYNIQTGQFHFEKGPVFHHLVLADEINRAPAKAQSALLEAMSEQQITVGQRTYPLPALFLVMATQNPLEHAGTYPLPEAQLDRFLLHVEVHYPNAEIEYKILKAVEHEIYQEAIGATPTTSQLALEDILEARLEVLQVHLSPALEQYIIHIVMASRNPLPYGLNTTHIACGASPRATLGLARASRALAWLSGRDYVLPQDIQHMTPALLRHRIVLSYSAEAQKISKNQCIADLLNHVQIP
jgi:MoxR-like ATPase